MFTRSRRKQRDFSSEIASHIALEADRLRASGLSDAEAQAAARRAFGNTTAAEEHFYESRGWLWWDEAKNDFRYAGRTLVRTPAFAAAAIITLALGIGANTAIFSVVDAVALRSLPYPQPDRIRLLYGRLPDGDTSTPSPAWFLDFRREFHSFASLAAYRPSAFNMAGQDQAERIEGAVVTPDFFTVMGIRARLGRTLDPSLDAPGQPRTVVLSDAFWRRRYTADRAILGQAIQLDGESRTVVGVMPPEFEYPPHSDVWVPARYRVPEHVLRPDLDQSTTRDSHYFFAIGRLRPGVGKQAAGSEADLIARRLRQQYPEYDADRAALVPLDEELFGEAQSPLSILLAAVGLLLLIACANVANLVLARGAARRKEIAIRAALGASRPRLIRQLLTESLALAGTGCVLGIGLAYAALGPVSALLPPDTAVRIDLRVLGFAAAVSAAAGILCGVFPALALAKAGPAGALSEASRGSSAGGRSNRIRAALVVSEVALTVVLLIGAGLLIRSFERLAAVPAGFSAEHVLSARLSLPQGRYSDAAGRARFVARVLERLRAAPGVLSAGVISRLPLLPGNSTRSLDIKGRASNDNDLAPDYLVASPEYFRSMGIRLLRGRMFTDRDDARAPAVVLINTAMARHFWGQQDPIGQFVTAGLCANKPNEWCEVVGVVDDIHQHNLEDRPQPAMYVPYARDPWPFFAIVVRAAADPAGAASSITAAVHSVDHDQPVYQIRAMSDVIETSVSSRRVRMLFVVSFASLALILACIGIYGIVSYGVAQRIHEIGIRMALGAGRKEVLALVIGHGLKHACAGAVAGLALAAALSRLIAGMLYEVRPTDAASFTACLALVVGISALASYLPARRAMRVDPARSLRGE